MGVRVTRLAILLLLAASPAGAGVVHGVVWPTAADAQRAAEARATAPPKRLSWFARLTQPTTPTTEPARSPGPRKPVPMPALHPDPSLREAVVWVESVPDKVERSLASRWRHDSSRHDPRIIQADSRFIPRVSAVAAGTDVQFLNLDRVWHNVFSVSRASQFDLGKCPPGRVDTVHFEHAGLVNLHCDIHPEETAFVMVTPNHAFARPDSLGRFALPKLPAGSYELMLWHPRLGQRRHGFKMPKHGDVDLDLSF